MIYSGPTVFALPTGCKLHSAQPHLAKQRPTKEGYQKLEQLSCSTELTRGSVCAALSSPAGAALESLCYSLQQLDNVPYAGVRLSAGTCACICGVSDQNSNGIKP